MDGRVGVVAQAPVVDVSDVGPGVVVEGAGEVEVNPRARRLDPVQEESEDVAVGKVDERGSRPPDELAGRGSLADRRGDRGERGIDEGQIEAIELAGPTSQLVVDRRPQLSG